MSFLKAFTTELQSFINEFTDMFPKEKYLKVYSSTMSSMIRVNPKMVHTYFMQYVYPYKNQILNKEEKFFMEKDYTDEIKEIGQVDLVEAMKLKTLWEVMTPESKDNTWLYLSNLIKLSERV